MAFTNTSWGFDSGGSDWRESAACLPGNDVNPEWFFHDGRGDKLELFNRAAKAVCRSCPVRDECLTFAVTKGEAFGIWGGMTADERKVLLSGSRVRLRDTCRKDLHRMDGDNVGWSGGGRFCKACRAASKREWDAQRAVAS